MSRPIEEILKQVRVRELELQTDHRISPATSLGEVYRSFDERRQGAAMICAGDRVVGIFTQRDVLDRIALENLDHGIPISEVMSPSPVTVRPDQRLAEAIEVMVSGGYRHAPVVDEHGRQMGLLSSRVILRFIAEHFPEAVLNLPPRLHQVAPRPEGG
jgi:CBS domain-containing protein